MKSIAYWIVYAVIFVLRMVTMAYVLPLIPVAFFIKKLRLVKASLSDTRAERGVSEEKRRKAGLGTKW